MAGRPSSWWVFHGTLLAVCAASISLAFLLAPGSERVAIAGWEIPEICLWKNLFGWSCPGCGMTRSWVYLAHGDWMSAFRMNALGPILFLAAAIQIPLSGWRLFRLWRSRSETEDACPA